MRRLIVSLLIVIVFIFPSRVYADVAPPPQPPGSNLEPGSETTQVRMVSETVNINVLPDTPINSLGRAKVTADFTMRNLGSQDELMKVRFPLGHDFGYPSWKNITDLAVKVNSHTVSTKVVNTNGDNSSFGVESDTPWAVFDVNFPTNQDVSIQVMYTLEAGGEMPFVQFDYIFATGAGWKDTIGSATLNVTFPYQISDLNILPNSVYGNDKPILHQSAPDKLSWVYTDLEPQPGDNFQITIVAPSIWKAILKERSNVEANPMDGEAWGRLGKLYKQIAFSSRGKGFRSGTIREDQGAQDLFNLSRDAYQKAVALKPDDPLWHAGFADLLGYYVSWVSYEHIDSRAEGYQALSEIKKALELAPKDAKVLEIADNLSYEIVGGMVKNGEVYDYPGLTATPELPTPELPLSTVTPTLVIMPTSTKSPDLFPKNTATLIPQAETPTHSVASTPKTQKGLPICGSLILVPFGLVFWLTRRKIG